MSTPAPLHSSGTNNNYEYDAIRDEEMLTKIEKTENRRKTALNDDFWKVSSWLTRVVLGILFLYSGFSKIINPSATAQTILSYKIPLDFINYDIAFMLGILLCITEISLGAMIFINKFAKPAALGMFILLAIFISGIMWAWSQGLLIDCGCYGENSKPLNTDSDYIAKLVENIGWVGLSVITMLAPSRIYKKKQSSKKSTDKVDKTPQSH